MKLNLDKLKAEANQTEEQRVLDEKKKQQINKMVAKHKTDLKALFENAFAGENISAGNGGNEISVSFGEIKISMFMITLTQETPNGILLPSSTIDPVFSKKKSGIEVFSIKLVDTTKYSELAENSTDYVYKYKINDKIQQCKFAEINSILHMVIDA